MASKKELEDRISRLENNLSNVRLEIKSLRRSNMALSERRNDLISKSEVEPCAECRGLFLKSAMKEVTVRSPQVYMPNPFAGGIFLEASDSSKFYCKKHAPKHDIEEYTSDRNEPIYKKKEGEKEVNYKSKK